MFRTNLKLSALLPLCAVAACSKDNPGEQPPTEDPTAYITKVLEYRPAPGQFVNELPEYEEGDTQEDMNRKVLEAIGNNNMGLISLGGFGGYVTVGFDHTIQNKEGLCDFRVLGNAFFAGGSTEYGSSEPGVISVCYDANGNGIPDDGWYEIAGSSHNGSKETWLAKASQAGNDTNTYTDYQMTYYRPESENPASPEEYIRWEDNKGASGFTSKLTSHKQPYFPQWISGDKLTFTATRLPQNGIDLSGNGTNYALYQLGYGYADNAPNQDVKSAIDIDWATDANGNAVNLPGVDFIRIHCGVNQQNGWLGECSTEIMGIVDLHILQENIPSEQVKGK